MSKSNSLSKESSIYHYTLLKRHSHSLWLSLFFWLPPVALALWLIIHDHDTGLWGLIAAALLCPLTTRIVAALLRSSPLDIDTTGWRWHLTGPWFGYWPQSYTSLQTIAVIQRHQLFIGILTGLLLIPWVNEPFWIAYLAAHVHINVVDGWVLFRIRTKDARAVMKIEQTSTSVYLP